jgi:hypothetical protein
MRKQIAEFIKKLAIKALLKKIFGAAIGGVQGFIATWVIGKLWDKYLRPFLMWSLRKLEIIAKRPHRKKEADKLIEANNEQAVLDALDNLD